MSGGDELLRRPAARALLLAAMLLSLVLGVAFVVIDIKKDTAIGVGRDGPPLSDEQSMAQVIDAARHIVDAAQLHDVNGTAIFLSCTNLHDPPYQAAVYLNLPLPRTNSVTHIREIAAAMVANGWQEAQSMGEHFGLKLVRDGVTSTFHENLDDPGFATMRIYGQCRNMADHRNDNPAWTDITGQLG